MLVVAAVISATPFSPSIAFLVVVVILPLTVPVLLIFGVGRTRITATMCYCPVRWSGRRNSKCLMRVPRASPAIVQLDPLLEHNEFGTELIEGSVSEAALNNSN